MRDVTLLRRLLGFPGVTVKSVSIQDVDGALIVGVKPRGKPRCSRCRKKCPRYDRLPVRTWRHLDFGPRCVWLTAALARVNCKSCGIVVQAVSFADPRSGFTKEFEEEVGWLLQRCDKTTISTLLRIAWRTVGAIVERLVDRIRPPIDFSALRAISVDELSWRKGHRYVTIVTDLEKGRVIWTGDGKSAESLSAFFKEIGDENCARIRYVALDMSAAYTKAVREALPNAQIVYDRFHVMQLLSQAVDDVRRIEWRNLQDSAAGDSIKHTRYAVLHRPWNVTPEQNETLATLPKLNAKLFRAYLMKEAFAGIYWCDSRCCWIIQRSPRAADFREDTVNGRGPDDWLRVLVVNANVLVNCFDKAGDALKRPTLQPLLIEIAEQPLNHV
jgi:transposase